MKKITIDEETTLLIDDKKEKPAYTNDDVAVAGLAVFTVGALFGAGVLAGLAIINNFLTLPKDEKDKPA